MIEYGQRFSDLLRNEMNTLYVTSDRPGAGKTVTALALVLALQKRGLKPAYLKPFCLGADGDGDVAFANTFAQGLGGARALEPSDLALEDLVASDVADVAAQAQAAAAESDGCDALVVEGPSLAVARMICRMYLPRL